MRDIKIIINDDGYASSYEKFIGIQNENEATRLVFDLPDIYKKDGSYQYVAFTLPDGTIKVRSLVDYACIIDSEITSQRGVILISVIIKSVENVLDIETGFIMSSQPISGYIKKTILEETGTNSIDKNVRIYLDEFDALLMEIRSTDARLASLLDSDPSRYAEVIDARGGYTVLKNRLDAMLSSINNNYNNIETNRNNIVSNYSSLLTKINAVASGSPLVASSTSEMVDTTRVYVNTSDGKWYYYNGSNWTAGGTYQSDGIADGSIDILKFDDNLKDAFIMEFDSPIELTDGYQGYVTNKNGVLQITQAQGYVYYIQDLELGAIYNYVGHSRWSAQGIVVVDSNNNVILNTSGNSMDNILFKVNQSGLKAYIGTQTYNHPTNSDQDFPTFTNANLLRKVKDIRSKIKISTNVELVQTLTGMGSFTNTLNNVLRMRNIERYDNLMYAMKRGEKYHIKYAKRFLVQGLLITDKLYNVIYAGDATYPTVGDIEYTATTDGFIFLLKFESFVPEITKIVDSLDVDLYKALKGKKIIYDGDSITESRLQGTHQNGGAYPKIIADLVRGTYSNHAVGGGTLSLADGQTSHSVVNTLTSLETDGDIYVFSGGVNDWWSRRPLGNISETYDDDLDINTVTGAVETIFRYALSHFLGKPIVFVITQKVTNPFFNDGGYTQFELHDRLVEVCEKYSIPYYDAFNNSGLNGWCSEQSAEYLTANSSKTPDGTHPNENGYKKYYVPQLLNLFESLIEK